MTFIARIRMIAIAWLSLEALRLGVAFVIPAANLPSPGPAFAWTAVTDLISLVGLSFAAVRSDWRGARLGAAVAGIVFTIAGVNIVEGHYYLREANLDTPMLLAQALATFLLVTPLWGTFLRSAGSGNFRPFDSRGYWARGWRILASDAAYLVVYLAGGIVILPLIKHYYATRILPDPGVIFALQLGLRGPLFTLACVLLVRMLGMPRWSGALAVAAIFSLASGVAPLVVPTPYLPDAIRWIHFCEVSITNFIFAFAVAAMWGPGRTTTDGSPAPQTR